MNMNTKVSVVEMEIHPGFPTEQKIAFKFIDMITKKRFVLHLSFDTSFDRFIRNFCSMVELAPTDIKKIFFICGDDALYIRNDVIFKKFISDVVCGNINVYCTSGYTYTIRINLTMITVLKENHDKEYPVFLKGIPLRKIEMEHSHKNTELFHLNKTRIEHDEIEEFTDHKYSPMEILKVVNSLTLQMNEFQNMVYDNFGNIKKSMDDTLVEVETQGKNIEKMKASMKNICENYQSTQSYGTHVLTDKMKFAHEIIDDNYDMYWKRIQANYNIRPEDLIINMHRESVRLYGQKKKYTIVILKSILNRAINIRNIAISGDKMLSYIIKYAIDNDMMKEEQTETKTLYSFTQKKMFI